jgi:hypothetical protein
VETRAVQALPAEDARAVAPEERRDDEIAGLQGPDVGADGLDHADELVSHATAGVGALIVLYGQRSLPQIAARVTETRASVGSCRRASGTVSTRTSPAPYMTVARMRALKHGTPADDRPC